MRCVVAAILLVSLARAQQFTYDPGGGYKERRLFSDLRQRFPRRDA